MWEEHVHLCLLSFPTHGNCTHGNSHEAVMMVGCSKDADAILSYADLDWPTRVVV